jgi:hypothetical protein
LKEETLRGALVDKAGNGVEDAPVVIGQKGKLIKELRTDSEGRWQLINVQPGVYQIVSHGSASVYRVWSEENAPTPHAAACDDQHGDENGGGPHGKQREGDGRRRAEGRDGCAAEHERSKQRCQRKPTQRIAFRLTHG